MFAIGLPELLIILIVLGIFGVVIWLCSKTPPLGDRGYGYATYIAVTTGLFGVLNSGLDTIRQFSSDGSVAWLSVAVTIVAVAACVGILLRRKLGVVALVVGYGLDFYRSPTGLSGDLLTMVVMLFTLIYFQRRWRLLKPTRLA